MGETMMYLVNAVCSLVVRSYVSKVIGYLLMSYSNENDVVVQKLLAYPMRPRLEYAEVKYPKLGYVLTVKAKEKETEMFLTSYYKDVLLKLLIKHEILQLVFFVFYLQMMINQRIYALLKLLPKVVAKMLAMKKKGAGNWLLHHYSRRIHKKREYDEYTSKFFDPYKRVNWIKRIEEIKELKTIYNIKSRKIRSLIKIVSDYRLKKGMMQWHIPDIFLLKNARYMALKTNKIIKDAIYKYCPYMLPEEVTYIERKYFRIEGGFLKGILKKVNDEYVISICDTYVHDLIKKNPVTGDFISKNKIPTKTYYKYVFHKNNIENIIFNKSFHVCDRFYFSLQKCKGEIKNIYFNRFIDLFIKVFKLKGMDIPYIKEAASLEHYFKYSYLSRNLYEIHRDFPRNTLIKWNMVNEEFNYKDPNVMKSIWKQINIPKSLRTAEAAVIVLYLQMKGINECDRIKYATYFYPCMTKLYKESHYYREFPNFLDVGQVIAILYKHKKSVLKNLDAIIEWIRSDKFIRDTFYMIEKCDSDYPEELRGYLERFKLNKDFHDELSRELEKLDDKEVGIPYQYNNIFKDQKVFDLGNGYELRIPTCKADLVCLGNRLWICVGSSPTYHTMIKHHEGYIFMIYRDNEAYGCVQYQNGITQAMLEYNRPIDMYDSMCYKKLQQFVNTYKKEITTFEEKLENVINEEVYEVNELEMEEFNNDECPF
jgi:hypothetical protein